MCTVSIQQNISIKKKQRKNMLLHLRACLNKKPSDSLIKICSRSPEQNIGNHWFFWKEIWENFPCMVFNKVNIFIMIRSSRWLPKQDKFLF